MDCQQVEDLLSAYIENDLPTDQRREVRAHLEQCRDCCQLKEQMEQLIHDFPDLEEDVPFYLKNRLLYIHESQQLSETEPPAWNYYLNWVAAVIGTVVLFLNLFYFTNIYPPANRVLHSAVSKVEIWAVESEAFFEKLKESRDLFFAALLQNKEKDGNVPEKKNTKKKNGGKNG